MKGKSFETFHVTRGNQEAYAICRRIATLEDMGPALIILLGPEGCGKSHLLWSIAKHVRAGDLPAGLALLAAGEIPEKVRALVEDPRPIQGRRAMLLVDGLERFTGEARRVDALIETFQACQHPVIVATSVHPNRLSELSVPLVNRLTGGRVVAMEARVDAPDEESAERINALEGALREVQRQRDSMELELKSTRQDLEAAREAVGAAEAAAATLQGQSEHTASQLTSLQVALDNAQSSKVVLENRVAVLERDVEKVRGELNAATRRIQSAESEADYALAQQSRLQAQLAATRMELEEERKTRAHLAEAEFCITDAVQALSQMTEEHAARQEILGTDTSALVEELAGATRIRDDGQSARLRGELAESRTQEKQLRETLSATRERLQAVEYEWAKSKKAMTIQTAEMDALRNAAASQAARASIHAGELEQRIAHAEEALDALRATRPEEHEVTIPDRAWSMALENMQAQLAALRQSRDPEPAHGVGQALFEADFFEALPEDFDVGDDADAMPGAGAELREALQGALGGPDEDVEVNEEETRSDVSG